MNFIKTAFWVIIAVALALFTKANWVVAPADTGYVPIKLWGEVTLYTRLPVLILAAFLLGLVPMWLWSRATKWQMKRKLGNAERALASAVSSQQEISPSPTDVSVTPSMPETSSTISTPDPTKP